MPVGVEVRNDVEAEADRTGVVEPMSTPSRAPEGLEAPLTRRQVTTASPRALVPRSGAIATAIGLWSTATLLGGSVPMGLAVRGVSSMVVAVVEPGWATTASSGFGSVVRPP